MSKLSIHPNAPCRLGDRRFTVTLMEVPTRADVMLGIASPDHNQWPRVKWAAYGTDKANAIRRAEGYES
jgi:hypothetical protein